MPTTIEESDHDQQRNLAQKIARVLDDVRSSNATHIRKLKDLSTLRASSPVQFFTAFSKALVPLFNFQRRTASAERMVKFVSLFAFTPDAKNGSNSDEFLENFLRFLLLAAEAANKTARFRACQIISEIIMRLPDDAEVNSELWDEVIECMKSRVGDKVPVVRSFAIRALLRFANESENRDILDLFLQALPFEQNADVRKTIVLSLPPSNETLSTIIDCTLDVSESVRKAAFCVIASKFPLQTLSIRLRTTILQRGLEDRSTAVAKECLKLMKDEWLLKCCNRDPIELLKFLDVETYESVGESVMATLLKEGLVSLQDGQGIRQFLASTSDATEGDCNHGIQLMEAEVALYWRMVCKHLQMEASAKGSDAAMTTGAEAAVYAAEASDHNDLLDRVLPAAVSEYVEFVNAHIAAGPNYRFASRQLLLLGTMLDFSDASNRKVASAFVQELLHRPLDHELDDNGIEVVIGDGINLGGERDWAAAVAELAKKVHAAAGEFEKVVLGVVEELARPCRERTADCKQWLHSLAVTALLLENISSLGLMRGVAMDPNEILHSLLLAGAKHGHLDVQRAALRCLGLFGLLERKPSEELVRQLRCSFVKGPSAVTIMASKALLDLGTWHGPHEVDKAMNCNLSSQLHDHRMSWTPVDLSNGSQDLDIELLDLLYAGLERQDWGASAEVDENESIQAILGEGLAKILLLSEKFPGVQASTYHLLLAKLIILYFCSESSELQRLKQCLSVFFEHYPSLSVNHKKCISKAFMPAMRSLWPGINGNATGSTIMVSNMRKRAVQASRFMLQMMQVPLYAKETARSDENDVESLVNQADPSLDFESGEEGLAIRIAVEVASFHAKKTQAEKSYLSAVCRILVLLQFRASEQGAIKLVRQLLNRVSESVAAEKDLLKELWQMAERLKEIDGHPDQKLSSDQTNQILGRLALEINLEEGDSMEVPLTPALQSTRPSRARRRARVEEESSSDDELSPTSVAPTNPVVMSTRSQRASKTAAMTKMTAKQTVRIDENDEGDDDDSGSEVTSEDDSDALD
ncbi:ARM repeat superfamily protein [Abeliophyllum distichum]|uniref:ARM repeat superfamily protein n=1 Tax=Abeliophyllum distichum TaxID=126358 RepID=A0ABD1SVM3_9LAMI